MFSTKLIAVPTIPRIVVFEGYLTGKEILRNSKKIFLCPTLQLGVKRQLHKNLVIIKFSKADRVLQNNSRNFPHVAIA